MKWGGLEAPTHPRELTTDSQPPETSAAVID